MKSTHDIYIYIYIYIYIRRKTNRLQVHPYKPVSWSPTHQGIDEWATTKQACRDELVVYLFYSLYFYVLSTGEEKLRESYRKLNTGQLLGKTVIVLSGI